VLARAALSGTLHVPSGPTTAVPSVVAPLIRVTVAPGSPVPLTAPMPLVGAMAGVVTAVSMVTGTAVGALVLPAASVAVTARLFTPCGKAVVGVALQVPSAATVAVAMTAPLASLTVMVALGSPVPLKVGVVSLVLLSPCVPLSLVEASAATGAAGAVVSMVTGTTVSALTLPCGSVAVTLKFCKPSGKAAVGVMAHVPLAATTAVPSTAPLAALRVMVSPGVAPAPLRVGVVSVVVLSPKVPLSLTLASAAAGAAGAVVSMVTGTVVAGPVLPAGSVALTCRFCRPSASAMAGVTDQVPSLATVVVPSTVVPSAA